MTSTAGLGLDTSNVTICQCPLNSPLLGARRSQTESSAFMVIVFTFSVPMGAIRHIPVFVL